MSNPQLPLGLLRVFWLMVRHAGEAMPPSFCVPLSEKLREKAAFPLFYMFLRATIFRQFSSVKKIVVNYAAQFKEKKKKKNKSRYMQKKSLFPVIKCSYPWGTESAAQPLTPAISSGKAKPHAFRHWDCVIKSCRNSTTACEGSGQGWNMTSKDLILKDIIDIPS